MHGIRSVKYHLLVDPDQWDAEDWEACPAALMVIVQAVNAG